MCKLWCILACFLVVLIRTIVYGWSVKVSRLGLCLRRFVPDNFLWLLRTDAMALRASACCAQRRHSMKRPSIFLWKMPSRVTFCSFRGRIAAAIISRMLATIRCTMRATRSVRQTWWRPIGSPIWSASDGWRNKLWQRIQNHIKKV